LKLYKRENRGQNKEEQFADIRILEARNQRLKKQLEIEKKENQKLRSQLADSSGQMKPSVKEALAQAGTEEGAGSDE
jgi:hypothetical protein